MSLGLQVRVGLNTATKIMSKKFESEFKARLREKIEVLKSAKKLESESSSDWHYLDGKITALEDVLKSFDEQVIYF